MIKKYLTAVRQVKNFGFSLSAALAIWGTIGFIFDTSHYLTFYIISLIILLITLSFPIVLKPLFVFFSWFGKGISWIITTLVLVIIFYIIITPIGFILRLCKKDFMGKGQKSSYWGTVKNQDRDYEQQY